MRKEQKAQLQEVRRVQLARAKAQAFEVGQKVERFVVGANEAEKLAAAALLAQALENVFEAERQLALVA